MSKSPRHLFLILILNAPPQTTYRVMAKPNQPLLLTISLPIGERNSGEIKGAKP